MDRARGKRAVEDMSGFCRFPDSSQNSHRHCQSEWETPSALVTCQCECHKRVLVPKGVRRDQVAGGLVAKK